jgi:hypothetical protein
VREGDLHAGQPLADRLSQPLLVLGVAVRVQQAHGHRLGLGLLDLVERVFERLVAELGQRPVRAHPLLDADPPLGRHERRGVGLAQAVQVGARLAAERDEVLEARGGDQRGARAGSFQQRVRGHGGAVRERLDLVRRRPGALQRRLHGGEHALRLVFGRARRLRGHQAAVRGDHRVGERPADVDSEQHAAAEASAPPALTRPAPPLRPAPPGADATGSSR